MVKVISVHHFLSQDVTAIPGPTAGMSQSIDSEKKRDLELGLIWQGFLKSFSLMYNLKKIWREIVLDTRAYEDF